MFELRRRFCALALALFVSASCAPVAGAEEVQGHVVVARVGKNALVIWDATPDVIAIAQGKLSDQAANEKLERDALKALATKVAALTQESESVAVRIVYQKIAAVSSEYGNTTFAGVEVYATVTMNAKDAVGDRDKWMALRPDAPVPTWLEFKILGKLPPR